ncbi:MAG: membrane protein insertase YidC [Desulfobulbus propionicus]|nr:MAG: membrane protein insertase YidC [Desulfobulbus propionicus]
MDMYRAFLAVALSLVILIGYQYFFVGPAVPPPTLEQAGPETRQAPGQPAVQEQTLQPAPKAAVQTSPVTTDPNARDITVETPLYTVVINEQGGGFKSFVLKKYRQEKQADSAPMELVLSREEGPAALPLIFSLDNGAGVLPTYRIVGDERRVLAAGQDSLEAVMEAHLPDGTSIRRVMTFYADSYVIDMRYEVSNEGHAPVQTSPALVMVNEPFSHGSTTSRYLFHGAAALVNGELSEIKGDSLEEGPHVLQGTVDWVGYMDNYFITAVAPEAALTGGSVTIQGNEQQVQSLLSQGLSQLQPQERKSYQYTVYFGPKKLTVLKAAGHELGRAIHFGWFDLLAKPMLYLLNFFHGYTGNYGFAIILLTVLIKTAFWPITQKGMKSMKNMQKLQPKMAKIREKYKDDPTKMNQEVMALYKTYKVNPLGGCLPLLIQIPFFFALYRVLMAAIELRHAPFMLWINDLSAPDRLPIGVDIPYLHGLPVLTVLMGASMYLQQKMTPSTADPTQARIMQFLPIIFTFMFINFASGLVLYWFVNNLLSILQQYLINRQKKA